MNQSKNSTPKISIPKTADGCSVAVTSSFSMTSVMNMLDTGHYPKGGVLIIKKDMRKSILYKERTAEGRMLRKAYDTHKCSFHAKMKHRTPRTDGLSNTITSFFTDNLVLIMKEI